MSESERTPNMNDAELATSVIGEAVKVEEKPEGELTQGEQLQGLTSEVEAMQKEITILTRSVEETKAALNAARKELGIPQTDEDPPSVGSKIDQLERLKDEQEELERRKDELVNQQEKERLIREEKEKILQERLDEVFEEFESFSAQDLESIFQRGKTIDGHNVESKSMGSLNPELAQSLVKAFKEGIKLLPKILEILPELLQSFDEGLTKEATERVEKRLELEREVMRAIQEKEKVEAQEEVVPLGGVSPAVDQTEGTSTES